MKLQPHDDEQRCVTRPTRRGIPNGNIIQIDVDKHLAKWKESKPRYMSVVFDKGGMTVSDPSEGAASDTFKGISPIVVENLSSR